MLNPDPATGLIIVLSIFAYFGGMGLWGAFVIGNGASAGTTSQQIAVLMIFWPFFAVVGCLLFFVFWAMDAMWHSKAPPR